MPGPSLRALTSHFDPPEAREMEFSLPLAFLIKVPSYNICWPRLQCSGLLPRLLQHREPSGLHPPSALTPVTTGTPGTLTHISRER